MTAGVGLALLAGPLVQLAFGARWLAAVPLADALWRRETVGVSSTAEGMAKLETKLFAAIPQVHYLADQVWPSADGYFGRWYGDIEGETRRLRGFDVITLRQGLIVFNEVYTHSIEAPA